MEIIERPNLDNFVCPICGKSDNKPVTLIPINGTEEGNNVEVKQIHIGCISLTLFRSDDKWCGLQQTFYSND